MNDKKGNGFVGFIILLIFLGGMFAILKLNNYDVSNIINAARRQSDILGPKIKNCLENKICDFGNSSTESPNSVTTLDNNSNDDNGSQSVDNSQSTPNQEDNSQTSSIQNNSENINLTKTGTNISKDEAKSNLDSLKVVKFYDSIRYRRTEWKHWDNVEGSSCWTVREEVLDRQAEPNSVVYLNKNNEIVKDKTKACGIKEGVWKDPYTSKILKDPSKVDIDHTSALAFTARAGGQEWDNETKRAFANDYTHLVATSQEANRGKGDKGPSEWMPANKNSWCDYSKTYITIMKKYNLNVIRADKDALNEGLKTCKV